MTPFLKFSRTSFSKNIGGAVVAALPWRSRSGANEMSGGMERVSRGTAKDPTGRFAAGNALIMNFCF